MACPLFGAKSLSKPVLGSFKLKYKTFLSQKCIRKHHLQMASILSRGTSPNNLCRQNREQFYSFLLQIRWNIGWRFNCSENILEKNTGTRGKESPIFDYNTESRRNIDTCIFGAWCDNFSWSRESRCLMLGFCGCNMLTRDLFPWNSLHNSWLT